MRHSCAVPILRGGLTEVEVENVVVEKRRHDDDDDDRLVDRKDFISHDGQG